MECFILFVLSLASQLFFVYIVRITVLIAANCRSQKLRVPDKDTRDKCDFDPSISKSARYFQCYFVIHVCAQTVAQILIIITIAAAIREENKHLFVANKNNPEMNMDESIHASNQLWYMLVAGYTLPICGILSFFIVTYFWVQEFPIGICIDVMSGVLHTPGLDDLKKIGQPDEEELEKQSKIHRFIHLADLKSEFKGLRDISWGWKFLYPFQSPQTAVLSIIYAVLQAVFVAYRILRDNAIWIIFGLVGSVIGFIANFYVFSIAIFWISLFIFAIIALILTCLCITCKMGESSNNEIHDPIMHL